jgi:raffinose/stachyose/melibiose transport system substrate-binding protein
LVNEGIAMNLSEVLVPTIADLGTLGAMWEVDGQPFGLPFALGPAGFWVNLNLLDEAGLVNNVVRDGGNVVGGDVDWPTSFDGLFAMWQTLKSHHINPVAVGGGSGWAASWWYYALATKICSAAALQKAGTTHDFVDPCWEQAAVTLADVVQKGVFHPDWAVTLASGSADSAAGQVVGGEAAMELMGPWALGEMTGIYSQVNANGTPSFITWYPIPSVSDGAGAGNVMMGGAGFSVLNPDRGSEARSEAAAALLAYLLSESVQMAGVQYQFGNQAVNALPGAPVNPTAAAALTDTIAQRQAQNVAAATFTLPWLDVYLGPSVAGQISDAVNSLMRGQGTVAQVVNAIDVAIGNY